MHVYQKRTVQSFSVENIGTQTLVENSVGDDAHKLEVRRDDVK
jgi:hypothetical protein